MTPMTRPDKILHLFQPAWLIRCLIHRLVNFPHPPHTSIYELSHSHEIWLPHELLHSGSPMRCPKTPHIG